MTTHDKVRFTRKGKNRCRNIQLTTLAIITLCVLYHYRLRNLLQVYLSTRSIDEAPLHVIAFGDSLTAGLYGWPWAMKFHPYTDKLERRLRDHFLNRSISVKNAGISGERLSKMQPRLMNIILNQTNDLKHEHKLVVILAGTNDVTDILKNLSKYSQKETEVPGRAVLGAEEQKKALNIVNKIIKLHIMCHLTGIRTIAVSIPGVKIEKERASFMEYRQLINDGLKAFVNDTKRMSSLIDLDRHIPRHGLTKSDESVYWDDGVHMTEHAYDKMADLIFDHILHNVKSI